MDAVTSKEQRQVVAVWPSVALDTGTAAHHNTTMPNVPQPLAHVRTGDSGAPQKLITDAYRRPNTPPKDKGMRMHNAKTDPKAPCELPPMAPELFRRTPPGVWHGHDGAGAPSVHDSAPLFLPNAPVASALLHR